MSRWTRVVTASRACPRSQRTRSVACATLLVAGLFSAVVPPADAQPRIGESAPEITGSPWVNAAPVTLGALRGRVVLVDFWTYG